MEVPVRALPPLAEACFGLAPAHANRFKRFVIAERVGLPEGRPGPGGSAFLQTAGHMMPFILGCSASPTAADAGKAVRLYSKLIAHVEPVADKIAEELDAATARADSLREHIRLLELVCDLQSVAASETIRALSQDWESPIARLREIADNLEKLRLHYERMIADRKPPPGAVLRLRDEQPHDLGDALTWLLDAGGDKAERERLLAAHIKVTIERAWPAATIEVDDRQNSGIAFNIHYFDPKDLRQRVRRERGRRPRASFPCVFHFDVIAEFGALLDPAATPEGGGAPQAEAHGAPPTASRHPQPEDRPASHRDPSANSRPPQHTAAECIAFEARIPAGTVGGSPHRNHPVADEDRRHDHRPHTARAARARAP